MAKLHIYVDHSNHKLYGLWGSNTYTSICQYVTLALPGRVDGSSVHRSATVK